MNNTTATEQTAYRFRAVGISDEVLTCDCCGRTDLKRTIALMNESGDVVYFGTTCAALAMLGTRKAGKVVENLALKAQSREREIASLRHDVAYFSELIQSGHVRYPIGGKPIGAELAPLLAERSTRLARLLASA